MLILQGENQKAVIINELSKSLQCVILSDTYLAMEMDYYQYDEFDEVNISNMLAGEKKSFSWIIIYTNSSKEKLSREIKWLQHLENTRAIMNSIITCR